MLAKRFTVRSVLLSYTDRFSTDKECSAVILMFFSIFMTTYAIVVFEYIFAFSQRGQGTNKQAQLVFFVILHKFYDIYNSAKASVNG